MDSYTSAAFPTFGWTAATAELAQLAQRKLSLAAAFPFLPKKLCFVLFSKKKERTAKLLERRLEAAQTVASAAFHLRFLTAATAS
jgi:hypothetical protein